ncbi:MAG: thiamine diphosphokinase [Clostridiales bacterium]|jgi:thiamine pyrophosphokinase|nr:thiamine diphosphokinase [Clostridiales bacterium]
MPKGRDIRRITTVMTAYIFGAGELNGPAPSPQAGDMVLAADGGWRHVKRLGLSAGVVIGDFDSLEFSSGFDCEAIRLPREKDVTDMAAAIEIALARGFKRFVLYGGAGGRLDHTMANIQSLVWLSRRGAKGFLWCGGRVATALTNGQIAFAECETGYISVFAHSGKAYGVSLEGLKYELKDAVLSDESPIGVSNEFLGRRSIVAVCRGTLVIMYEKETPI